MNQPTISLISGPLQLDVQTLRMAVERTDMLTFTPI